MSRSDLVGSINPQQPGRTPTSKGSDLTRALLLALPVAVLLAALFPGASFAAEPTSGYGQTTTTPKTTPAKTTPTTSTTPASTGTTPKSASGTSAAKETSTASKEAAPATTSTEPTTKESTLPFTGLDLRWVVGIGLLLLTAGFSLLWVQRRQRGGRDHSSR
jgi:hypothetical protein